MNMKMKTLYPTDYKQKDPRAFLFNFPNYIQPVKLSKSFSNFLQYSTLSLMVSAATHQEKIVVPFSCFTWKRIRILKDMNMFYFKINQNSYFMISELDLKAIEKNKLTQYMDELKWNE